MQFWFFVLLSKGFYWVLQIKVKTGRQRFRFPKAVLELPPQLSVLSVGYPIITWLGSFIGHVPLCRVFPWLRWRFSWFQTLPVCVWTSKQWNFISSCGFHSFKCHFLPSFILPVELACLISSFSCLSYVVGFPSPTFEYPVNSR